MKRKKKEAAFSVSQRLLYLPTFVLFTMKVTRKSIRFDVYFLCKWAVKMFVVGNVQKFISETFLTDDMLDFSAMQMTKESFTNSDQNSDRKSSDQTFHFRNLIC